MDKELLVSGLGRIGAPSDERTEVRLERFISEIMLFNPALKLVGDKDPDEIIIRHVLDSAAAYPVFMKETAEGAVIADLGSGAGFPGVVLSILMPDRVFMKETAEGAVIADLGSGAGFPGVVLSILMPDRHFVLVERMQRRSQFLKGVLARTGLENAEVDESDLSAVRRRFDAVTCRAFHPVFSVAEDVLDVLLPGAPLLLYKGQRKNVSSELDVLRGEGYCFDEQIVDLHVPYLDEARTMAVLRNISKK